jgi:hypothetical protein
MSSDSSKPTIFRSPTPSPEQSPTQQPEKKRTPRKSSTFESPTTPPPGTPTKTTEDKKIWTDPLEFRSPTISPLTSLHPTPSPPETFNETAENETRRRNEEHSRGHRLRSATAKRENSQLDGATNPQEVFMRGALNGPPPPTPIHGPFPGMPTTHELDGLVYDRPAFERFTDGPGDDGAARSSLITLAERVRRLSKLQKEKDTQHTERKEERTNTENGVVEVKELKGHGESGDESELESDYELWTGLVEEREK